MKNQTALAYFFLVIVFFLWGSMYVFNRIAMEFLPPIMVTGMRSMVAFGALLFLARKLPKVRIDRADLPYLFLLGGVGYYFQFLLNGFAVALAGASIASLINSMTPVFITIIAAMVLKEKITPVKVLCLILAFIGTYIVTSGTRTSGQVLGVILMLIAVISWSTATTYAKKLTAKYNPLLITTYGMGIGVLLHIPTTIITALVSENLQFSWKALGAIVYMGIFSTGLAHYLWNRSLSVLEAGTGSLFYPLQPFFSVLLGVFLLNEELGPRFFIGSAFIAADVLINGIYNWREEKKKKNNHSHTAVISKT